MNVLTNGELPKAAGVPPSFTLRVALAALLLWVLLAGLYPTILRDLVSEWWDDPNYSHGFLVPIFSGVLVWLRRRELAALGSKGNALGFPVVLLGVGALVLGDIGAEFFLMRVSLIVIITGLILFHFGSRVLRALAFPLGFLVFMVPLPAIISNTVTFPLQRVAAENSASVLDLMGVPVFLDGNVIHLSRITLGVTEACSGIRSLISLVALAVAWAHLTLPSSWAFGALVAAAVPITIVTNAGRVVATGLIGQWFGAEYARGMFHTFSGWVLFVFAFAGLFAVHGLIRVVARAREQRAP